MDFQKEQSFTISEDALFQEVSGETVLLDLVSENYFGLDEAGTRVWALLVEGASVGQIVNTLLDEYEVDRTTVEKDVNELLGNLVETGLIAVREIG